VSLADATRHADIDPDNSIHMAAREREVSDTFPAESKSRVNANGRLAPMIIFGPGL
jgi:hypothetical protein